MFFAKVGIKGWLLDGFPRNVSQASRLEDVLRDMELSLNLAIALDVDEDEIINRICGMFVTL